MSVIYTGKQNERITMEKQRPVTQLGGGELVGELTACCSSDLSSQCRSPLLTDTDLSSGTASLMPAVMSFTALENSSCSGNSLATCAVPA